MTKTSKIFCFFCNFIIPLKSKVRVKQFNNKLVKICMDCNSKKHKVLETKYKNSNIACSICLKKVMNKTNIHCKLCNYFVHSNCANLNKNEIKQLELPPSDWYCPSCIESILPINVLQDSNPLKQCFSCSKPILSNSTHSQKIIYDNCTTRLCNKCYSKGLNINLSCKSLIEYIDCRICNKNVKYSAPSVNTGCIYHALG